MGESSCLEAERRLLVRHRRGAALHGACGRVAADSGCRPPGCRLEPFQVTAGGRKARSWKKRRGGRPLGPALRAAPSETPRALEENAGRANEKGPPVASLYRGTAKNTGNAHPAIHPPSGTQAGHTYPLINKARCRRAWFAWCCLFGAACLSLPTSCVLVPVCSDLAVASWLPGKAVDVNRDAMNELSCNLRRRSNRGMSHRAYRATSCMARCHERTLS